MMTKEKKIIQIILILILGLSQYSYAGNSSIIPLIEPIPLPKIKNDIYLGLSIGELKLSNKNSLEKFSTSAITIHTGYKYNKYLSIEAQYSRNIRRVIYDGGINGIDDKNYPTIFTNIAIYIKLSYKVSKFNIYTLLGYGDVKLTNLPRGNVARSEDGFQYGVGIDYEINKKVSIFSNFLYLYKEKGFNYLARQENIDVTSLSIGVNYHF